MTIQVFGVDTDYVMTNYLAQWSVDNTDTPGRGDLSEFINKSGALVDDALLEAGFSLSDFGSSTTEYAWNILKNAVALGAKVFYVKSLNLPITDDDKTAVNDMKEFKAKLAEIKTGKRIGEVRVSDGVQQAVFSHGDDDDDDIETDRLNWDDSL